MRHHSILEHARFRWFKAAALLCIAAAIAYLAYEPPIKHYGGTWLGYTLGTAGGLLILWLLYYGVRRRSYHSNAGTVQGWLSAHVYLGTSLLVIVTLHTGFELGWNVHSLAYVLMVIVILSGFYGVFVYASVPRAMTANLGEDSLESLLLQITDLDRTMREKALSVPDDLLALIDASVTRTRLGGNAVRLISGRDPGCPTDAAVARWAGLAKRLTGEPAVVAKDVYALLVQKQQLLQIARRDLRHKAILDLWLYVHVACAYALLAALVAHVIAVFIYW